jgi:hypothetical protein
MGFSRGDYNTNVEGYTLAITGKIQLPRKIQELFIASSQPIILGENLVNISGFHPLPAYGKSRQGIVPFVNAPPLSNGTAPHSLTHS